MQVSYRKATKKDIQTLIEIAEKTWFTTYDLILLEGQPKYMFDVIYSAKSLAEQMLEGQNFIIQSFDNQVVGFASYSLKDDESKIYKLNKLYLLPEKQGLKLGQKLLSELEKRVLKNGAIYLDLNVNRFNKARVFYEKCGFEIIAEEDIAIGIYFMNDFVMRKKLINF